jgi:hypothetical protein
MLIHHLNLSLKNEITKFNRISPTIVDNSEELRINNSFSDNKAFSFQFLGTRALSNNPMQPELSQMSEEALKPIRKNSPEPKRIVLSALFLCVTAGGFFCLEKKKSTMKNPK